eukprot:4150521-Pleurochrysis_carterae.AAC.1
MGDLSWQYTRIDVSRHMVEDLRTQSKNQGSYIMHNGSIRFNITLSTISCMHLLVRPNSPVALVLGADDGSNPLCRERCSHTSTVKRDISCDHTRRPPLDVESFIPKSTSFPPTKLSSVPTSGFLPLSAEPHGCSLASLCASCDSKSSAVQLGVVST